MDHEHSAIVAHDSGCGNGKGKRSDQLCDFYGKERHTVDQCWDKDGKPKWAIKGNKSSNIPKATAITISSNEPNSKTFGLGPKDVIQISKEEYERLLHS